MGAINRGNRRFGGAAELLALLTALALVFFCSAARSDAIPPQHPSIVGGSPTTTEEWPWQVFVTDQAVAFACGGTLIDPEVVLTAAHCLEGVAAEDLVVVFGATDLSVSSGFLRGAQATFVAPQFDINELGDGFDFGLIHLDAPVTSVTPISLATSADGSLFQVGDSAWATGYGLIDASPPTSTTVLHEVQLTLANCPTTVGVSNSLFFCVADTGTGNGTGVCSGDSGGPLMIDVGGGTFRQIGVTSFGDQTCNAFHAFTNVAVDPVHTAVEQAVDEFVGNPPPTEPPPGGGGGGDTVAPETTITKAPKPKIKTRKKRVRVTIEFSSSEAGSSFACSLDGGPTQPCSSPHSFKVKKGRHTFTVAATDAAGNTDASPATASWRVKRIP